MVDGLVRLQIPEELQIGDWLIRVDQFPRFTPAQYLGLTLLNVRTRLFAALLLFLNALTS